MVELGAFSAVTRDDVPSAFRRNSPPPVATSIWPWYSSVPRGSLKPVQVVPIVPSGRICTTRPALPAEK